MLSRGTEDSCMWSLALYKITKMDIIIKQKNLKTIQF